MNIVFPQRTIPLHSNLTDLDSIDNFVKHIGSINAEGLDLIRNKCSEVFKEYSHFITSDLVDDCIVFM